MNQERPKEERERRLRYLAKHGPVKAQICQVYGQRIVEIYLSRGFHEISEEEFNELVRQIKEKQ